MMQSDRFHRAVLAAMLLAIMAAADAGAGEPFAPSWLSPSMGSSAQDRTEPVVGDRSAESAEELRRLFLSDQPPIESSAKQPSERAARERPAESPQRATEELRRLFLTDQRPVERPMRLPSVHLPVEDPGYPRVGNLVQAPEEAAGGGATPIGTAALIKTDADLSMQKIKAIKYLATAGCECSSQSDKVRDALLAALDDCSEEVRYEAALAFCRSAGNPCSQCNSGTCCGAEVMERLAEVANGRDSSGCWLEPSGHVRAAARRALEACRRVRRHRGEVTPTPTPGVTPETVPDDQAMQPEQPSLEDMAAAAPSSEASSMWATPSPTGTNLGMIGDFLGGPGRKATIQLQMPDQTPTQVCMDIPASGLRRFKIAENNSTLPRDRFFFNYSYFHDVLWGGGSDLDVNRFVFGVEKTFHQERSSIEIRIPFGSTINSTQRVDGVEFAGVEFGNIGLLLKHIFCQGDGYAIGAGLAMEFPTGDDLQLYRLDDFGNSNFATPEGTLKIMHLNNEAYHLMPWLGMRIDPNERLFIESFLQFDFGLTENSVFGHSDGPQVRAGTLPSMGQVYDQTLLLADISINYWLYRDRFNAGKLMGVVPSLEFHYTTSLQDPDVLDDPSLGISMNGGLGQVDQFNLTLGTHFVFHRGGNITPALVVPLADKQFEYELQLQMNVPY